MSVWSRIVEWFEAKAGPPELPPVDTPEYERLYVRRTRPQDDAAADEALRFLQEYVSGIRADRDRRPPRR